MRIPEIKDTCIIAGGEHKGRFGRVVARGIMMGQDAVTVQLRAEDGKSAEQIDIPVSGVRLTPDPKGPVSEAILDGKPVSEFRKEISSKRSAAIAHPSDDADDVLPLPPDGKCAPGTVASMTLEGESVPTNGDEVDAEYEIVDLPEHLRGVYDLVAGGPVTNKQLLKAESKYRKRLRELQEWLECNAGSTIVSRPVASGVTEYRIIEV